MEAGTARSQERVPDEVLMVKCECGHQECFHHRQPTSMLGFFAQDKPTKACNIKECACLRFTKVEE